MGRLWVIYDVVKRAIWGFTANDGAAIAGYMAYTGLLSLFPFLIFTAELLGEVFGEAGVIPTMDFLFTVLPSHVVQTLEPAVREVLETRPGDLVSVYALIAIWIASNSFEALRTALDRAYGYVGERHFVVGRLISIGFTLAGVAAFIVISFFVIVAPTLRALAPDIPYVSIPLGMVSRWVLLAIGAGVMFAFLLVLHYVLPAHRPKGPLLPGVIVTAGLWIALASLFSVYFQYVPSYSVTYGTLAGVIVSLLFFYISGAIFIFGAEVNAALDPGMVERTENTDSPPLI
jgi:membrane protein